MCLPNDYVVFVDGTPQRSVFNGKPIPYDDTGSASKAVKTQVKHTVVNLSQPHTDTLTQE